MREILFRGQTRRKGEKVLMDGTPVESNWVYGGVYQGCGDHSIIYGYDPVEKYPVYSDTVGQFVGRTDRNRVKIFEDDIVKILGCDYLSLVVFENGYFGLRIILGTEYDRYGKVSSFKDVGSFDTMEVVGNIHDNSELLKIAGKYADNDTLMPAT